MSKKDGILNLVLKKEWFDKIASGEKTHEYRKVKPYWSNILSWDVYCYNIIKRKMNVIGSKDSIHYKKVRFQLGYQKNAPKMVFEIKDISTVCGEKTDLKIKGYVYDIELGERIE